MSDDSLFFRKAEISWLEKIKRAKKADWELIIFKIILDHTYFNKKITIRFLGERGDSSKSYALYTRGNYQYYGQPLGIIGNILPFTFLLLPFTLSLTVAGPRT